MHVLWQHWLVELYPWLVVADIGRCAVTAVVTLLTQIHGTALGPAGQALVLLTDGARSAALLPLLLMGLSLWVSNKTERGTPRKGRWGEEKIYIRSQEILKQRKSLPAVSVLISLSFWSQGTAGDGKQ